MRQIVFSEPFRSRIHEQPIPECGEDQVLLKMLRVGVCGTDIQVFSGRNRYMQFPVTPFHEGVAKVHQIGSRVTNVKVGDMVTIRPILNCGNCYSCTHGHENACENFNCLGVQSDGLGADYVVIDHRFVYTLPEELPLDISVLIEPFAVGVHAARRGQVANKRVLVIGGGTIGNFTAQACKLEGAKSVCVCDPDQDKIVKAEQSGIDYFINNSGMTLTDVANKVYGTFPDVIIDCVGAKFLMEQILNLAGKTTTVVIVGNYSEPIMVDIAKIQRNELNVFGNITYTEADFKQAIEWISTGKVFTDGFISAQYDMEHVQEMMDYAVANRGAFMKIVMNF